MRIKIITKETGKSATINDVRVIDVDTGDEIPGVYKIEWSADADALIDCKLWLREVEIHAEGYVGSASVEDNILSGQTK